MKKLVFILIVFIISISAYAQNFEGEIIYQSNYKSKIPSLSDDRLAAMMGARQEYFIQGNHYKTVSSGALLQWQVYVPAENMMYTKMANNPAALWTNAAINSDSVLSMVLNKGVGNILGYQCDELIMNCRSGIQKYYFSSRLSIDSKLYAKHLYGNWYYMLSKTNAVPLKMIIDNSQFTLTSTAVEVKPSKLDHGIFQLPDGIKTDKSPY